MELNKVCHTSLSQDPATEASIAILTLRMDWTPIPKQCLLKLRTRILFSTCRDIAFYPLFYKKKKTTRTDWEKRDGKSECACHKTLCISLGEQSAGINGLEPVVAPQQQGKMGRCYTTSATPDKQTPCAAHFPPIRSRRRSCPMCLPSHSLLDTFVLWLDRCRGSAVKCARREPTTSITDKERSGCEHPHHTHFREREKKVWQRKGMMRSFFFIYIGWALLETLPQETNAQKQWSLHHDHAACWLRTTTRR